MKFWCPVFRRLGVSLFLLGGPGVASAQTGGLPPNIHFVIDASASMRELPQLINSDHITFFNNTLNGCENPDIAAYQQSRSWDPNFQYPVPDSGTGLGTDTGHPNLFRDDKYYGYMYWLDGNDPPFLWNSKEEACQSRIPGWSGADKPEYDRCLQCLSTKGYYKHPEAEAVNFGDLRNPDFILWGRFLNFSPPKYVMVKAMLKQVIKDLQGVRVGFSYFTAGVTPSSKMGRGQNPSCQQILTNSSAFDSYRASYVEAIDALKFTTGTPLARSLLNVGYYFSSTDDIYRNKFGFGTGAGTYTYPADFANAPLSAENRSWCWGCQTGSVIIVTDGEPQGDSLPSTVVNALHTRNGGPVYCPDSEPCTDGVKPDKGADPANLADDNVNYMLDDVVKLLATQDLQQSLPPVVGDIDTTGKQSLFVYTVGIAINSNLLKNAAVVGGGRYYRGNDGASLKAALVDLISDVRMRAASCSIDPPPAFR